MTDKTNTKINTYEKLGRFIMNEVYDILLGAKNYKIEYKELKRRLQEKIDNNPQIDKKFAMHELQHGSSKSYLSTYRWENVLYYYLMEHYKPAFIHFEYWEDKNGVHDYIALRADYLLNSECRYFKNFNMLRKAGKFTIEKTGKKAKEINSMFDWAQYRNKDREDYYLFLITAYLHLHKDAAYDKLARGICGLDFSQLTPEALKTTAEFYLHEESILYNRNFIKTRGGN